MKYHSLWIVKHLDNNLPYAFNVLNKCNGNHIHSRRKCALNLIKHGSFRKTYLYAYWCFGNVTIKVPTFLEIRVIPQHLTDKGKLFQRFQRCWLNTIIIWQIESLKSAILRIVRLYICL